MRTNLSPRPDQADRLPANYRLVLDILDSAAMGEHHTVHDVYVAARKRQPSIGFSTVYRALLRLRDARLISEILIPGAAGAVYERVSPDHAHFFCTQCAAVRDLDYHVPQTVIKRIAQEQEAQVSQVMLAVHGVCAACRG